MAQAIKESKKALEDRSRWGKVVTTCNFYSKLVKPAAES
jgi:hypothetical protein